MYIINFKGGLGNQLFQYFFSQRLKFASKDKVIKFSETEIIPNQQKIYNIFNLDIDWASKKELSNINLILRFNFLRKNLPRVLIKTRLKLPLQKILIENDLKYYNFSLLKDYLYFDGYWQNEKYFFESRDEICQGLSFRNTIEIYKYLNINKNSKNIALHIRRGDYLNFKNKNVFYTPPVEYFKYYINFFKERFHKPNFIFFSDDINWVKNVFKKNSDQQIFIDKSFNNGLDDFQLMSQCDHFILSNSTFGWWAAYLSKKIDKITICPNKWYRNDSIKNNFIFPKDWLRDQLFKC